MGFFKKATITKTIQLFSGQHKHIFLSCNLKPSLRNAIKQKRNVSSNIKRHSFYSFLNKTETFFANTLLISFSIYVPVKLKKKTTKNIKTLLNIKLQKHISILDS